MVAHIRGHKVKADPVTVSIEIEKTKSELMTLLPLADVVCYYVLPLADVMYCLWLMWYIIMTLY